MFLKKLLMYFFVASLGFLLVGCSEDRITEEASQEVTTKTVEIVSAEEAEKNWLDYSFEEKTQNVEEKLNSMEYTDVPLEEVVESLDSIYQDYDYTMVDFDIVVGEILLSMNQIAMTEVVDQYGGDSFSEIQRPIVHHVIEVGNKVYVLHSSGGTNWSELKVSIAENDEWIQKDKNFSDMGGNVEETLKQLGYTLEGYDIGRPYFYDNHLYFKVMDSRDIKPNLLLDYQFSETEISDTLVVEGLPFHFAYIETSTGKLAIMHELQDENLLYTDTHEIAYVDDISNPIQTIKPTPRFPNVVGAQINAQNSAYFNVNDGYLYVGDRDINQFDTNTGEPHWTPDGQELMEFPFNLRESIFQFYDKGFFTVVDVETNSIGEYDSNFNLLYDSITLPIALKESDQYPTFNQTKTDTEIKIWQSKTYQDRNYLEVVKLRKGYRPTPSS